MLPSRAAVTQLDAPRVDLFRSFKIPFFFVFVFVFVFVFLFFPLFPNPNP